MRRRLTLACALVAAFIAAAPAASAKTSWALPQIKTVVAAGLMSPDVASFHPDEPLTRDALAGLVAGLTHQEEVAAMSSGTVTMTGLDTRLVGALGLGQTARIFQQSAGTAGLAPPGRFGTETVARLLGLRTNHPAAEDDLELLPG